MTNRATGERWVLRQNGQPVPGVGSFDTESDAAAHAVTAGLDASPARWRADPADRKGEILDAAVRLAERDGYRHMTRDALAVEAACSPGLVSAYFGRMCDLRDDVMREAITRRIPWLVLQGLAARDPIAQGAPDWLKGKAAGVVG